MSTRVETYEQALEYLFGRINFERIESSGYSSSDFKLDRMRSLLEAIGSPHLQLPAIHVAGTKGKGSTCSLIASALEALGVRSGLFTSPHLVRYEERMRVAGKLPTPEELVGLVQRIQPAVAELDRSPAKMHPTYFEITNALAWQFFLEQQARVAVLETGLGGRLDSTNLCRPRVTVITNVSRDHTQILGSTVREIAREKAGIIKPGIPVISGCQHPDAQQVVLETSRAAGSELWLLDREITWTWHNQAQRTIHVTTPRRRWTAMPVPLRGDHQVWNTALALAALDQLPATEVAVDMEAVREGIRAVNWPARVEVIAEAPRIVLDAAHNWESAKALLTTLNQDFTARRRVLVFACSQDKDYRGLLRLLTPHFDSIILTRYVDNPRAVAPETLQRVLEDTFDRNAHVTGNPVSAWKLARRIAHPSDLLVITGSLFLVAELRDLILDEMRSSSAVEIPTSETTNIV